MTKETIHMFSQHYRRQAPVKRLLTFLRRAPLVAIVLTLTGVLLALIFWTLPAWKVLAPRLHQFPLLWQTDRRTLVILVIKLCSPIFVVLLISSGFRLWWLLAPYFRKSTLQPDDQQRAYRREIRNSSKPVPGILAASAPVSSVISSPAPAPTIPPEEVPLITRQMLQDAWQSAESPRKEPSARAATLRARRYQRLHHISASKRSIEFSPQIPQMLAPSQRREEGVPQLSLSESPVTSNENEVVDAQESEVQAFELQSENNSQAPLHPPYEITLRLLKQMRITLQAQGFSRKVQFARNAKRVQLLAYVAWRRGDVVQRDRMLEHVFGHGRDDDEATPEKLGEAFDSHKKLIRADLRETIQQLNTDAGRELIPPNLDIFAHKHRLYSLAPVCRVVDLDTLEREHQIIEGAHKKGLLTESVPDSVKEACDRLIAAYTGDFLEDVINNHEEDFEPLASSWARVPFTLYRDYYLQALWYAAEYELQHGQAAYMEWQEKSMEKARKERRRHWERAALHYRTYALKACDQRFDSKVAFGNTPGERIVMSERALRRCLMIYGMLGATHLADQAYAAYYKQMRTVCGKIWEPSKDTLADLAAAKEQTNAYRFQFPDRITPHDPSSYSNLKPPPSQTG